MAKKRKQEPQRFSATQYFEQDEGFCPFKDVKLKKSPQPVKKSSGPLSAKVYDMYTPGGSSIVQKNEQLPIRFLRDSGPQKSLDLHGKRPGRDDIKALVDEFLLEAVEKGLRKIEIIVGKGNHSNGEPVVPAIAEAVLKASEVVMEYAHAPSDRGGTGSFWVILGKRSPKAVNVYSTTTAKGGDIRGVGNVRVPAKIDYEAYMPKADDILDKGRGK